MAQENWKPVVGWEELYAVSDQGRVLGLKRQRLLTPQPREGHLYVVLHDRDRRRKVAVHTLMLESFVGPRPSGMQACHWDDVGTNNTLSNLRWDTHAGNSADRERNNTQCPAGHDYTELNTYMFVRKDGRREKHCRRCRRERWAEKHGKTGRQNRTKYRE